MKAARSLTYMALAALLLTALGSCSGSRQTVSTGAPIYVSMSLDERFSALASEYSEWEDLVVPLKVELSGAAHYTLSGRASMRRGESILLSFRMLGLEVASLYLTQDSVFVAEKMHKYLFAESLSSLIGPTPLTVSDIQDLLLGRPFIAGRGTLTGQMRDEVTLQGDSAAWSIAPVEAPADFAYSFSIPALTEGISALQVEAGDSPLECAYGQSPLTESGRVASSATIPFSLSGNRLSLSIRWDLNNARWNTGKLQNWSRPHGYATLAKSDVAKLFSTDNGAY